MLVIYLIYNIKGFILYVHSKLTKVILNIYQSTRGCEVSVINLSKIKVMLLMKTNK